MHCFDSEILKEPNVYRTYEVITHYDEAMKLIIHEQCGDGIMSAIDFYCMFHIVLESRFITDGIWMESNDRIFLFLDWAGG